MATSMTKIQNDLAHYLKKLRLSKQWTREALAEYAGINVYTLKHFERTGQISLERFLMLCQSLGLLNDFIRAFKPRVRINQDWSIPLTPERKRGSKQIETIHTEQTVQSA